MTECVGVTGCRRRRSAAIRARWRDTGRWAMVLRTGPRRSDDGRIATVGWDPPGVARGVAADVGGVAVGGAVGAGRPGAERRPASLDRGERLVRGGSRLACGVP